MQFTQRQRLARGIARPVLAALGLGLLLGFAGPFGSYPAYPAATRSGFWLAMTAVGMVAVLATDAVLPRSRLHAGPLRLGALALASALPMTFVVAWTMSLLQPGRVFTPGQLPLLFACVAAVQLLVAYAATGAAPARARGEGAAPVPAAGPAAFPRALLGKLPAELGRDILALETEDHYLRVHAACGSALILMRMADAVALLDPRLGAQVHRRWWVADAAVTGVRTEGQRLSLCLANGALIPVGRTFLAAAKARFVRPSGSSPREGGS